MADLSLRGLKPATDLAASRPHGDRLKYIAGCRCDQCRRANSAYEAERQKARKAGDWNGIVPADRARAHLLKLSKQGIGRRAVGAASDVADSVLMDIRSGRRTHIRARTERRILAVTVEAAADRALIAAKTTWKLIDKMLSWGYSKSELAKRLGYANGALQFGRETVTARNAFEVEKLYQQIAHERKLLREADRIANRQEQEKPARGKNDGDPIITRKSGHVDLKQPDSVYAAWGGYR